MSARVKEIGSDPKKVAARIRSFPKQVDTILNGAVKKHIEGVKTTLVEGISSNSLGLSRLKDSTVASKTVKGMPKPKTPLYGWGDKERRSMINGLRIFRTKQGWRLRPYGKHYPDEKGRSVEQSLIWAVHEFGATIGNGFGKGIHFTITARKPISRAVAKYLRSQAKKATDVNMREAAKQALRGK